MRTSATVLAVAAALALTSAARAAVITECGELNDITLIPDPVSESYQSFNDGALRVFAVDTFGEPVSGSAHAIITIARPEEIGVECFRLSASEDGGYAEVFADHAILIAREDEPAFLFIPVKPYGYATEIPDHRIEMIRLRIDWDAPSVEIAE